MNAIQVVRANGGMEDNRIQYYVRRVHIRTNPAMLVMVDGLSLGEGQLCISMQRHALEVMVDKMVPTELRAEGLILDESID